MQQRLRRRSTDFVNVRAAVLCAAAALALHGSAEAPSAASAFFARYTATVEARLSQQHASSHGFLAEVGPDKAMDARLRSGERIIEHLTPADQPVPHGALLHHWRGTAFVSGASAADFERLMKDLRSYPRIFAPQILFARIMSPYTGAIPDRIVTTMRVRQQHVITVVLDATYDVAYGSLDPRHRYSIARSIKISEISSSGKANEHALSVADEHGFLWRMNTYWSYEERDGGLYMQIESISLTRSIPTGLDWLVRPFVESVPRESLDFTLRSTCNALKKQLTQ